VPHPRPTDRRSALRRLAALAAGLTALFALFALGDVLRPSEVQAWIAPAGLLAPLAYVLIAGVLGAVLVPGAALSAAAGLLFGAVPGALISLPSAVLTAVLARWFSARHGSEAFDAVSGPRLEALTSFARRNGLAAVVVQRLLPVVPDGPFSHAFGLAGVRTRDVALGTLIASGPRALSYALLGANADDLTGTAALVGIGLNVATGAVGLTLAALVVRRERARAADEGRRDPIPPADERPAPATGP
jgi:uncharacterized membrane protein YdjX (TVP38/TMEM64 family)